MLEGIQVGGRKMNKQIIYIAIYRVLECLEEEQPNPDLADYLDKANPYVFVDRKSADPVYYNQFVEWLESSSIDKNDSFGIAKRYICENTDFAHIFAEIDKEEWDSLIEIVKSEEPQIK